MQTFALQRLIKLSTSILIASLLVACGRPSVSTETVSGAQPAKVVKDNKAYDDGEHIVFFNAIPSSLINANVAKSYNIVRSDSRALTNVSIHTKNSDGSTTAINADINVKVTNLTGQLKPMELKRISEQDSAIYYIGMVNVSNGETLIFDLNIKPEGGNKEIDVKYKQSFFNE